jgi:hypothetical protein
MANSYLLETPGRTTAITGLQIATFIGSLSRSVELLAADIEHEEARAGVRELADPTYPVFGAEPEGAKGEHWRYHCHAREPSGAKSHSARYGGTRGGIGNQLTEHRARGDFSY